jgi:lipid-A-disaccharide synthase
MPEKFMKKVFIIAGELSGDQTAAWYVRKVRAQEPNTFYEAVGGDYLQQAGVTVVRRFESLNVTGIIEIITHLPKLFRCLRWLTAYIKAQAFDEVVLVDFPGFNLRLAARLRAVCPRLNIIYLAPPQLWCWGAWRLKKIKKLCQAVVVLYPFEVAWYAQRGMQVRWLGLPMSEYLAPYLEKKLEKKMVVALVPGSRPAEVAALVPVMMRIAGKLKTMFPQLEFVLPVAQSLPNQAIEHLLAKIQKHNQPVPVRVVVDAVEKYHLLQTCCLAITKPGTVTLELSLLRVPSLVVFRTSWMTYLLARLVVTVPYMALPNLLLGREIFPEFIQGACTVDAVTARAVIMLDYFQKHAASAQENDFDELARRVCEGE